MIKNLIKKNFFSYLLSFFIFSPFIFLIASSLIFLIHFIFNWLINISVFIFEYFFLFILLFFLIFKSKIINKNIFINLFLFFLFLFQFFIFYFSFYQATFPHHVHDASNHIFFIKRIQEKKTLKPSVVFDIPEIKHSEFYYQPKRKIEPWYPFGFHTGASFICQILHNECVKIPWMLAWFYASTIGVMTFFLTNEFFKKEIAILSSIFTTIFYLFPYMPFGWGGWAQVAGQVMIFFSLIFIIRYFKKFDFYNGFLAIISSVSLFYTHTTDFLTFLMVVTIFILLKLIFNSNKKIVMRKIKGIFKIFLFIIIFLMPVLIAVLPGFIINYFKISFPSIDHYLLEKRLLINLNYLPINIKNFYLFHLVWINKNEIGFLFFLIGFLFLIINKNYNKNGRFFIGLMLFFLPFTFLLRFSPLVGSLLSFFYPWNQFERIMYSFSLFYPTISAVGLYLLWKKIKSISFKIIFLFLFLFFYFRTILYTSYYISYLNDGLNPVTNNDLQMFKYLKSHNIFNNKLFFTDPFNTAGAWLNKISPVRVFFPMVSTDYINSNGWFFLSLFSNKNIDEKKICQEMINKKVDYVFIGERNIIGKGSLFDMKKVNRVNCIKLIKSYGESRLYQVKK